MFQIMRFLCVDYHAATCKEIQTQFRKLGHQVDEESLSDHASLLGLKKCSLQYIGWNMSPENIWRFYTHYKDKFDCYDGFIVCYPIALMQFFLPFNKPIIAYNVIRYEWPYTGHSESWNGFTRLLQTELARSPRRLWLIANGIGDRDYTEFYTHIRAPVITPICSYTNIQHDPNHTNGKVALFCSSSDVDTKKIVDMFPQTITLPRGHKWSDIYACKAVLHLPYCQNSMTLFEHYTSGIPIFAPSKALLRKWVHPDPMNLFSGMSFFRSTLKLPDPNDGSPNALQDDKIRDWWIDRMDIYDPENMPFIILFDSIDEYQHKLQSTNFIEVSQSMQKFNKLRERKALEQWQKVLTEIEGTQPPRFKGVGVELIEVKV
jgi:hypothetical protein